MNKQITKVLLVVTFAVSVSLHGMESVGSFVTYNDLTPNAQRLLDAACEAMQRSYSPYSKFSVGAAVECTINGEQKIVAGANCENVSYGLTICAERAALFQANNLGATDVATIVIIAKNNGTNTTEPTAPCGACRQVIKEFADRFGVDIVVIFSTTDKQKVLCTTINALLPGAFGGKDLAN